MKVSVITWDASFRERFHTIRCFGNQEYTDLEFIWVDYYKSSPKAENTAKIFSNFKCISLNNDKSMNWHLGECINDGVKASTGDLLIIPDGDIVVDEDFVSCCINEHRSIDNLALYFRRYDERRQDSGKMSKTDVSYLEDNTYLVNPTNYAGCIALKRSLFDSIDGYELHRAFAGPGINGMETNTRLRNAGAYIRWSSKKIYHPWHNDTCSSRIEEEKKVALIKLAAKYYWMIPYAGVCQSWIVFRRLLLVSKTASTEECDRILADLPEELEPYAI